MNRVRTTARRLLPLAVLFVSALSLMVKADTVTTVFTDKTDYVPGETVKIRGFDWEPGEEVALVLHEEPNLDPDVTLYATANEIGDISNADFMTDSHDLGITFTITATGSQSGRGAQTTFYDAGNPSATLDQCANDPFPSPNTDGCSANANDWVNGHLGSSKASYFEGDSVPYRLRLDNLSLASHTVTIEWDTTKSDKHAIDYLPTFNRAVATAHPSLAAP